MSNKHRSGPGRPGHTPDLTRRRATRRARARIVALRLRVAYLFLLTAAVAAAFTGLVLTFTALGWPIAATVAAAGGAAVYVVIRDHAHAWAAGYRGWRDHIVTQAHRHALSHVQAAVQRADRQPQFTAATLARVAEARTEQLPVVLAGGAR